MIVQGSEKEREVVDSRIKRGIGVMERGRGRKKRWGEREKGKEGEEEIEKEREMASIAHFSHTELRENMLPGPE